MRALAGLLLCATACGRIAFDPYSDGGGGGADTRIGPLNRAFIRGTSISTPFAGIAEADVFCQATANIALGGTFIALIGDETTRPLDRLGNARGWMDVTGEVLVDDKAEWFDGRMRRPLHRNEYGSYVGYEMVWLGARSGFTCNNWSDVAMPTTSIAYTTNRFDEYTVSDCTGLRKIACVEIAHSTPVAEPAVQGRIAFQTVVPWQPSGLASADSLCMSQAATRGFTGSFKALLATSTASALSRFNVGGPPWVRVDGLLFAEPTTLEAGLVLDAYLLRIDGSPSDGSAATWAWTGSAMQNCLDWTTAAAGEVGMTGDQSSVERSQFFVRQQDTCDALRPLVCLQE